MGRKALAILAALVAAAAGAWFLLPRIEGPGRAPPAEPTPSGPLAPRGPAPAFPTPSPEGKKPTPSGNGPTEDAWKGACSLRGRATNPDGTPWHGLVALTGRAEEGDPPPPVRTAADGTFRFDGLPRIRVRLVARDDEDRAIPGPLVLLPFEEEVPFVVGAGLIEVAGRVIAAAEGKPVVGATVSASGIDSEEYAESARTDAEGRFLLHLPDGECADLKVEAAGFLTGETQVDGNRAPGAPPIEVRLRRGGTLEARVVEADSGRPVAGIPVIFGRGPLAIEGAGLSDGSGLCPLDGLRPGKAFVCAVGNGWVSSEFAALGGWDQEGSAVVVPEGGTVRRDLLVVPAPSLRGRVVDAAGRGVPGIEVEGSLRDSGMRELEFASRGIARALEMAGPLARVTSGADGGFAYPVLLPGFAVRYVAKRDSFPVAVAESPPAAPGETVEVLLRIPESRTVTVRVVDGTTGEPRAGVEVQAALRLFKDESWGLEGPWKTGPDGTVAIGPFPALPWEVRAGDAKAEVPPESTGVVELRVGLVSEELPCEGDLVLEGTVLLPDGSPAAGADFDWTRENEGRVCGWGPPRLTDFRGRFRIEGLPAGRFTISASLSRGGRRYAGEATFGAGTTNAVVRLVDEVRVEAGLEDPGNAIRVRVLSPDGRPVPSGEVRVHFIAEDGSETSDARGVFEGESALPLPEEPAARMWIEVSNAADAPGSPLPFAHGVFGPFPCGAGAHEVRLAPEAVIEGRVVDAEGRPVEEVELSLGWAPEAFPGVAEWSIDGPRSVATDAAGRFRIARAGDFPYLLEVKPPPRFVPKEPLPVRGGARDVVVTLRGAASPIVTVLGPDGKPLAGALVRAGPFEGNGWNEDQGPTGPAGDQRLFDLDPELLYDLRVEPPEDRDDLVPFGREAWRPADTTVRLGRGFAFQVLVKDPLGRPVEGVGVSLTPDSGRGMGAETDAEGVARFRRVPAGGLKVEASIPGPGGRPGAVASAAAQAEAGRAELVLDAGGEAVLRVKGWDREWVGVAYFSGDEDLDPTQEAVGNDGTLRLRGLAAGKAYNLYIRQWEATLRGGAHPRCALLRGVRAGDPPREVELVEGKDITGKAILPEGAEGFAVAALLGKTVLFDGIPEEDGSFRIPAMPEGTWTVVVYLTTEDGKYHAATGAVPAGGAVEIRVP